MGDVFSILAMPDSQNGYFFGAQLWISGDFLVDIFLNIKLINCNIVVKFCSIQPTLRGHSVILFSMWFSSYK